MISKKSLILKLVFLFLSPFSLLGWWDTGHMAIAQIAYERLDCNVKKEIDRIIAFQATHYPACSCFITAACFADDLNQETTLFSNWHIGSTPYNPNQILTESTPNQDIVWVIERALQTLKNPRASDWMKHLSLCLIVHMIGDLHQPLHCAELYNDTFLKGDKGGNLFKLEGIANLHFFWDSMCGLDEVRLKRPLTIAGSNKLSKLVNQIEIDYPERLFVLEKDLELWHQESYSFASFVYAEIEPNKQPSAHYKARGQEICKERIAAAGYRLALLLNNTLKDSSSFNLP